jgi:outer membrane lipoprotein-sorting protein
MARVAVIILLGVVVAACARASPEKARQRAAQEELKNIQDVVKKVESSRPRELMRQ